ncbi:hypothetical protein LTR67_007930 [Exophiala xenobiotica]
MPRNNRNGNGNGNGNNNRNGNGNNNGNGNGNRNNGRHPPPPPRRQPTQTHDQSQSQPQTLGDQDRDRGGDNVHNVQNVPIKSEQERALLSFHLSTTRSEEKVKIYVGSRNRIFIVPLDSLAKSPVLKALVSRSATIGTGTGTGTGTSGGTSSNNQNNDGVSGSGSGSGRSASRLGYSGSKNSVFGSSNSRSGSESFIMHPLLTKINPDHFIAVQQFLIMDEYVPAILGNPAGEHVWWPKRLDGHTSVDDYRRESVRAAHLYCLARRLGMRGLARLVVRKIVECGHQESEYRQVDSRGGGGGGGAGGRRPCSGSGVGVGVGVKCLLDIARVVFSRGLENEAPQSGGGGDGWVMDGAVEGKVKGKAKADDHDEEEEKEKKDGLEEWLIDQLGSKLQTVMTRHAPLFFEIAQHGVCVSREFQKRVLQRKVEMLEELGNVVLVEDDE